ncbi:hypothetical protein [Hymenobacter negativus]|uniref:DUF4842 domain-containing protein n=1 Tax=Hymenobacter negativus TaxID=2795026 RepID=A0ABS3QBQ2_9BACT|nr:hypothetical protein [Hymenobacter negativus]MBO2008668.1 hypothetical protein [Hymenobacter negativus]
MVSFPGNFLNVAAGTCTPFVKKSVTLTTNSSFVYNPAVPYEPFISTMYPGTITPVYDLYIYGVSHRDTWTSTSGKTYPNGILIPADWK